MSNIANSLRAVLELIASIQVRKAEIKARYDKAAKAYDNHHAAFPAIRDRLNTHAKAMYAALEQNDVDTAEREGVKYMKWTMEEKKHDRMDTTFQQAMVEVRDEYTEIAEEFNRAQADLTKVTSHGGSMKSPFRPADLGKFIESD